MLIKGGVEYMNIIEGQVLFTIAINALSSLATLQPRLLQRT
jgi:hypothetical protein